MENIVLLALTTAVSKLSENIIKDAYEALKNLILAKVKGKKKEALDSAIKNLEDKPSSEGRKKVLQEELEQSDLHNDVKLKKVALDLYKLCGVLPNANININQTSGDNSVNTGVNSGSVNVKIQK